MKTRRKLYCFCVKKLSDQFFTFIKFRIPNSMYYTYVIYYSMRLCLFWLLLHFIWFAINQDGLMSIRWICKASRIRHPYGLGKDLYESQLFFILFMKRSYFVFHTISKETRWANVNQLQTLSTSSFQFAHFFFATYSLFTNHWHYFHLILLMYDFQFHLELHNEQRKWWTLFHCDVTE